MADSFATRAQLDVNGKSLTYYSLPRLAQRFDLSKLPFSMKILLENLLRHEDGVTVTAEHIEAVATWDAKSEAETEIAFMPARVVLQDFTGVPCVVDLAAMRDAVTKLGGDASRINPLIPSELVIDHSVQVDVFGRADALDLNGKIEFERNMERYSFLRWGQKAFRNFKVVPPNTGIVHQVNLENLARVVVERDVTLADGSTEAQAFPDTVFGTDSHTTMINGIGVLGWGVGGIEAEAAMLGQPSSMLIPQVVGFKLTGKLPEGTTATDLVLTVTQMLRALGVVGKFVEFYGDGLQHLPLADRATIANMAPEYGATCGIFPIDAEAVNYLRLSGRSEQQIALVEALREGPGHVARRQHAARHLLGHAGTRPGRRQALARRPQAPAGPRAAGEGEGQLPRQPRRPHRQPRGEEDRGQAHGCRRRRPAAGRTPRRQAEVEDPHRRPGLRTLRRLGGDRRDHLVHQHLQPRRDARRRPARAQRGQAGPEGQAVGEDLARPGFAGGHRLPQEGRRAGGPGEARLLRRRLRLHHVHRQLRPAAGRSVQGHRGERTRRGVRALGQPQLRRPRAPRSEDELPGLAAAGGRLRAGRHGRHRPDHEPIGHTPDGKDVFLRDIWPSNKEIGDTISRTVGPELFAQNYADVFKGDSRWNQIASPEGESYKWDGGSTYIKNPPYFDGMTMHVGSIADIHGARVLGLFGDSITTDHISPAGNIKKDSPAGRFLQDARRAAGGLQQLRLAPRQRRRDGARHLRQHPHQEPDVRRRGRRQHAVLRQAGRPARRWRSTTRR
jgi:hypothetical protein